MNFLEESWFWTGAFSIIAASIGIFIKELIEKNAKIKLARIRLYDTKKFKAYISIYDFISLAHNNFWPPDEPHRSFKELMKNHYYSKVKKYYPYISKEIRVNLKTIESQYECLGDPDLRPEPPFEQFYRNDYLKLLNELENQIEKTFDNWESRR